MAKFLLSLLFFISCYSFSGYAQNKINIIFRIDDFGRDNEEFYPKLFDLFEKYKTKIVLAVVPFGKPSGLTERQKQILEDGLNRGIIEIAQHGYTHKIYLRDGDLINDFIGVPYQIQYDRIKKGKEYLEKELGIKINTFVPPQNQYDESTVHALDSLNFKNLSAGLNYAPLSVKSNLNFIPFTTTLWDFNEALENAKENNTNHDVVLVVMTHDFEFIDNVDYYSRNEEFKKYNTPRVGTLTLEGFEKILKAINNQKNLTLTTFDNLKIDRNLLTIEQLNNNTDNYLFRIPDKLHFSPVGYFPADSNIFFKYKVYPIIIVMVCLIAGVILALMTKKLYGKIFSINYRITIFSLILFFINAAAIVIILSTGFLGAKKTMLIALANSFFLILIIGDLKNRRNNNNSIQTPQAS